MKKWNEIFRSFIFFKKRGCIENELFLKNFLNDISIQEKSRLLDHISVCPECNRKFEAIRELFTKGKPFFEKLDHIDFKEEDTKQLNKLARQEIRKIKSQIREKKRPAFFGYKITAAVAGAVIIIIFSIFVLRPLLQGPQYTEYERKLYTKDIELIKPQGEVNKSILVFSWISVEGVKDYTLEVLDKGLETFFLAYKINTESFILPEETYKRLEKGEIYFWKITATTDKNQIIESVFGKFRITSSYE